MISQEPHLPLELILYIIDSLLPSNPRAILPPSHTSTKTLLSLARVSRSLYPVATKHLRQRCSYLESYRRLGNLLLCMEHGIPALRPGLSLRNITPLYLKPFLISLDDQPVAMWVRELFCEVCGSLQRLVVDIPFASLDPWADHLGVRPTLRDGFQRLTELREFVSLRDNPALPTATHPAAVWGTWPKLERLALFKTFIPDSFFWRDVSKCTGLQTLILARPLNARKANIKKKYLQSYNNSPKDTISMMKQSLKIILVDVESEHESTPTSGWSEIDPEEKLKVEIYNVPTSFYGDDTPDQLCYEWVRRASLNGVIWDWEGETPPANVEIEAVISEDEDEDQ
jgi:hypothetical protein